MDSTLFGAYLTDLIAGRRESCRATVERLLAAGTTLRALYVEVFQASLYEVGQRWERGEVSVAVEHVATSITEDLLAMVFPRAARRPRLGRKANIIADTLEASGWDVEFTAAGTTNEELVALFVRTRPDFVALSVSVRTNLPKLEQAVRALCAEAPAARIVVGGPALVGDGRAYVQGLGLANVECLESLEALERFAEERGAHR